MGKPAPMRNSGRCGIGARSFPVCGFLVALLIKVNGMCACMGEIGQVEAMARVWRGQFSFLRSVRIG